MLIDLHTHTRALSWDSDLDLDELIERSRKAGLDGVCLTEHDFFWDGDAVARAAERHGFVVIPGVEINTEVGHFLCFGIDRYVYGMHRWQELAEHVREAGGAMVAAHPYRRQLPAADEAHAQYAEWLEKASRNPAYAACAAIEQINGRGKPAENGFAARVGEAVGLPGVAGSDAHQLSDIGSCATEFERRVGGLDQLIEELRAGRFRPVRLNGAAAEAPAASAKGVD